MKPRRIGTSPTATSCRPAASSGPSPEARRLPDRRGHRPRRSRQRAGDTGNPAHPRVEDAPQLRTSSAYGSLPGDANRVSLVIRGVGGVDAKGAEGTPGHWPGGELSCWLRRQLPAAHKSRRTGAAPSTQRLHGLPGGGLVPKVGAASPSGFQVRTLISPAAQLRLPPHGRRTVDSVLGSRVGRGARLHQMTTAPCAR